MRYQERIYIQNDNRAVRNKDILNVNMSSDFCIFKSPTFDLSGTTKIQCGPIECNLSGFSSEDIFSAATYDCFTSQSMTTSCFSSATWTTKIYEDNELSYSATYYTSLSLTGDTPPNQSFINSLTNGLSELNYSYFFQNDTLTVQKQYGGSKSLEYDLCLSFGLKSSGFTCPIGYSATPANDACQKITSSAATYNGASGAILAGDNNVVYNRYGSFFYPDVQNNGALPVYYDTLGALRDQTGGTITLLANANTGTFWANPSPGNLTDGRLNPAGLSADSTYAGFSYCINIPTTGTYYLGISADNRCKFKLDNKQLVEFSGSVGAPFLFHTVFELNLTSGKHIIEMLGENDAGSDSAFCAEIYYPTGATPFATLTAATSSAATQANTLFTTENFIGSAWTIGSGYGYSCSDPEFLLDTCQSPYVCTKIENQPITGQTCTGVCFDNCFVVCSDTFPSINNTSQGVYILDETTTSIPVTFNFTGNVDTFTANTTSFKYEIYKYNNNLGLFAVPAVYKSENILYAEFSGTNTINESIAISNLSIDGEYIVKGFYESSACTDFLRRLGKDIDTSLYKKGSQYQLYEPELDYYFAAIRKADTPLFSQSLPSNFQDAPPLLQQVIIVDEDTTSFSSNSGYILSGATFVLTSENAGDILVTLNGLALAKNLDYTLNGVALVFNGPVYNGDIITLYYTRTTAPLLVSETIQLNSTITSGATNTQGSKKYFYNTTTNRYEIYTKNEIVPNTDVIVILNGITLTNNIDYYKSTSNKNRIILQGEIMVGDIITIIYFPSASIINGITQNNNTINWGIANQPQLVNGEFSLEYSNDTLVNTYNVSSIVP
jgi:hypothetical protein